MELPVAFGTFGGVVCPPTTARAPTTRSQAEKEESRASGTLLARETQASTRRPQSNDQPFKAQKTTEFIFLALKIRKQDGIGFLTAAQGSCAASVTRDAAFHAGGHCRRAQLHQMEFKALLSNVIHSLFLGGGGRKKSSSKENTLPSDTAGLGKESKRQLSCQKNSLTFNIRAIKSSENILSVGKTSVQSTKIF